MKYNTLPIACLLFFSNLMLAQNYKIISEEDLKDKIKGYWLGQLVGNYMGWPFEFMYNDGQPIPILIDKYFTSRDNPMNLRIHTDRRGHIDVLANTFNGAWSDDDSDIEFVYLHAVEEYGLDITNEEIAKVWKAHINRFIWGSNRQARQLMDQGLIPPETGKEGNNLYWWHIDPQLVNEIWSVFYPGMVDKAIEKATLGAHVMNDSWGTHPTLFYAALYSGAFIESDIMKLYQMGMDALPKDSPLLSALENLRKWHKNNKNWRDTHKLIYDNYYKYPVDTGQHSNHNNNVNAIINGLYGAMAILYGEGDFQKTVGIAVSSGLDCDNQAATCGGFIGVLKGSNSIPDHLTKDLGGGEEWDKPFNNQYINYSRDGLPNMTLITDIVERIYFIAESAILENGGEKFKKDGKVFLTIP